jgi:hypothetical protein
MLRGAFDDGIRACAIVLVHGYRYPAHGEASPSSLAPSASYVGEPRSEPADEAVSRATRPLSTRTPSCAATLRRWKPICPA